MMLETSKLAGIRASAKEKPSIKKRFSNAIVDAITCRRPIGQFPGQKRLIAEIPLFVFQVLPLTRNFWWKGQVSPFVVFNPNKTLNLG